MAAFISMNPADKWTNGRFASISAQSFEGQTVVACVFDTSLNHSLFYSVGIINNAKNRTEWGDVVRYDTGCSPSVSLVCADDNLYVVETHEAEIWRNCYYTVGLINIEAKTIAWRASVYLANGKNPKVAADSNGTVMIIREHAYRSSTHVLIGKAMWKQQEIDSWRDDSPVKGFRGTEPNITMCNGKAIIICRARGGRIKYNVGTYRKLSVVWGSQESLTSSSGTEFPSILLKLNDGIFGQYPSISLNSNGSIIEAHQSRVLRQLCYFHGHLKKSNTISWTDQGKSEMGEYPSVSLIDNNCFFEIHKTNFGLKLFHKKGKLGN